MLTLPFNLRDVDELGTVDAGLGDALVLQIDSMSALIAAVSSRFILWLHAPFHGGT